MCGARCVSTRTRDYLLPSGGGEKWSGFRRRRSWSTANGRSAEKLSSVGEALNSSPVTRHGNSVDVSEKNFEFLIEAALLAGGPDAYPTHPEAMGHPQPPGYGEFTPGGYRKRKSEDYDCARCLIPKDVLDFIYATQPKEWEKFTKQHGSEAKDRLFSRLSSEVKNRGTLEVLRKGIKSDGCSFHLAYFRPSSGLNDELQRLYDANLFAAVRQLAYSERSAKTLDLAIFLNGLPIFTAELKNPLTGQNVEDAVRQYRLDRDPKEPFFAFCRCLAHFAVDPDLVYVATHLQGPRTVFLPFNLGRSGGAGNPPSVNGLATGYLW